MRQVGCRVALTMLAVGWGLLTGGPGYGLGDATAAGESAFVGLPPCRLVDTRGNGFAGAFGPPALAMGLPRDFPLQGQCGIPFAATAVSLNVTATNTLGPGFLMLYPQGGAQPLVSTLNYVAGETVANAALVPLGAGGLTVVAGVSGTDLVLDVDGYFQDALVHGAVSGSLFVGAGAGTANNTGGSNTAVGSSALGQNTTGENNTAVGAAALLDNITGKGNTAVGFATLASVGASDSNTAMGFAALSSLSTGDGNIAVGPIAGAALVTGSNNIYVGSFGVNPESGTIRIGSSSQSRAFIAGAYGKPIDSATAAFLGIDANGKIGTALSSRRVKTDIEDIGERSRGLHALRPVSFRYRADPSDGPRQYGLIAEEAAEVYPELVVRDPEGAPETVRYHLLPALLLNELQRQELLLAERDRELRAQAERLQRQEARLAEIAATVAELAAELARLKK